MQFFILSFSNWKVHYKFSFELFFWVLKIKLPVKYDVGVFLMVDFFWCFLDRYYELLRHSIMTVNVLNDTIKENRKFAKNPNLLQYLKNAKIFFCIFIVKKFTFDFVHNKKNYNANCKTKKFSFSNSQKPICCSSAKKKYNI